MRPLLSSVGRWVVLCAFYKEILRYLKLMKSHNSWRTWILEMQLHNVFFSWALEILAFRVDGETHWWSEVERKKSCMGSLRFPAHYVQMKRWRHQTCKEQARDNKDQVSKWKITKKTQVEPHMVAHTYNLRLTPEARGSQVQSSFGLCGKTLS